METPQRCNKNRLNSGDENSQHFVAPETPFLKRIGYGTGIGVYHLDRKSLSVKSPKSPWAIKKVLRQHKDNNSYGERLCVEASLLRQLNHPNIVGFRGFTKTDDGREVLAMEECTVSLGDMIEQRYEQISEMFSADKILIVCLNVAKALNYLHNEVMLMHGDIKSHNVLINGDFKAVKLCDFGVSIKVDKDGKALGTYVGTDVWSAPEVLNEDKEITIKADVFSLGLVIYEMIALHPPHLDENDLNFELSEDVDYDEESFIDYENNYGTRPKLPDVSFGNEYNLVLEIYNSCTEMEPYKRPSSKDLIYNIEGPNK